MKKYIECEAVKEKLRPAVNDPDSVDFWEWQCSEIDSIPAADVVARDCYNRILAENDTMREQLAKIGKKPGDSMESVRQVRHAHWVKRDERRGSYLFYCSACGGKAYFAHGQNSRTKKEPFCGYPLCPNCGADMREVTDEP